MFKYPRITWISDEVLESALRELTPEEFKVFMLCVLCMESYEEVGMGCDMISLDDLISATNLGEEEVIDACMGMRRKGYLDVFALDRRFLDEKQMIYWYIGRYYDDEEKDEELKSVTWQEEEYGKEIIGTRNISWKPGKKLERPGKRHPPVLSHEQKAVIRKLWEEAADQKRPKELLNGDHVRHLLDIRNKRMSIFGEQCEVCNDDSPVRLILHHRHYRTWRHEALEDMVLLCSRCHGLLNSGNLEEALMKQAQE